LENKGFLKWKETIVQKAKSNRIPIMGQFELTGRCNLDCKMCYVHNLDAAACLSRELSTEEWKRIFDEAVKQELLFATLTGGECLLRPDFKELYLHLWKKGVKISILTNGLLLDGEYVAFFQRYKPEMIQISLYGSSEDGYLRVTGHKGFEKAVNTIRALMEAKVNVRVVTTPSRYMGDDYMKILRFCKERGLPLRFGELILSPNRDDPSKDDYFLTMDEIEALSVKREALYRELTPVDCTPEPCGAMVLSPQKGLNCAAGSGLASVMWDGMMYPCPSAMVGGGADLRKMSYADAWKHTVAAAAEVMQGAECVGCPYDAVCPKCPSLRLTGLNTGHCNPAVCELTRKLVAAGVKKLDNPEESSCDD